MTDLALRAAGAVVSLAGGAVAALAAVLAVPWRVDTWFGTVRMPVAVVFALVATLALLWFAPRATGSRWAVLLPAAGWFAVAGVAAVRTREGSILLPPGDPVAVLTLMAGTAVMATGVVLLVLTVLAPPGGRRSRDSGTAGR